MTKVIRGHKFRSLPAFEKGTSAPCRFRAIVWDMRYVKMILFFVATTLLAPFYFLILLVLYPWRLRIGPALVQFYSKVCLFIYRVRIERVRHFRTFRKRKKGLLIVSNHSSFLDIFVLSALFRSVFVSKAEVKHYPIIGQIAWLAGVVFFDRTAHKERIKALKTVAKSCTGRIIAVFPQGTTGRITERLPFNRGIFKVLELNPEIMMLPVTLHYREDAEIAWSGGSLRENAMRVGRQKNILVKVSIHHPVTVSGQRGKTTPELCRMVEETILGNLETDYREA